MDVLSLYLICFDQIFSQFAPASTLGSLSPLKRQGTVWCSLFFSCLQNKCSSSRQAEKPGWEPSPTRRLLTWVHCLSLLVAGPFSPDLVTVRWLSFAAFCCSLLQFGHGRTAHTVEGNLLTFWTGYSMPVEDVT